MKEELKNRTKNFAHDCIKYISAIPYNVLNKQIQSQLIRCSTSVAANYRSALVAQSSKSFVAKLSFAIEEVDESCFWLEFLKDEYEIENDTTLDGLIKEASELTAIFISSRKTIQSKSDNNK